MTQIHPTRRHAMQAMALALATLGSHAMAQAWPSTPITLIVPFPAGGTTDVLARALADKLTPALGQTVIVENKPGAGATLGADVVAKSKPDGTTLLVGAVHHTIASSVYKKLPYDFQKDFAPITVIAMVPNVLVVNAAQGPASLKDFVARAKARPGHLTYSSGGNGSAAHITFEVLKLRAGIFVAHIPYRGSVPSITDLLGGQVDATFTGAPALLPHIRSGRLRALAVSSSARLSQLPEVPTVAESGYPGFDADQWYGLVAPAGTPAERVARLNAAVNQALAMPEVAQQLATEGALPNPATPQAFAALIEREIPRWREVVRAGNVRPD